MFSFLQKINKSIKSLFYNLVRPDKSFPVLLEKKWSVLFIYTLSIQVFISFVFLVFIYYMSNKISSESLNNLINISYGLIIIFPFFIFSMTMPLHYYAKFMGGKGTLFRHYKMLMWSSVFIFVIALSFALLNSFIYALFGFGLDSEYTYFIYLIPCIFYSFYSMSSVHLISITRSVFIHFVMVFSAFLGWSLFNFFFDI